MTFWIFLSGHSKSKFFTLWLGTWIWTERLGLNFSPVIEINLSATCVWFTFLPAVTLIHCVHLTSSLYARKRAWLWGTQWFSMIYASLISYSSTPLTRILGNVVHRASPWSKQYQMVNVSAVRDYATKSPRNRNLTQYNCSPKSGLCACAVCRVCFSKREPVRLYTAGLVGMGRWNGDMHWKRSLALGCWDLGCRNNGNKNGWELGLVF